MKRKNEPNILRRSEETYSRPEESMKGSGGYGEKTGYLWSKRPEPNPQVISTYGHTFGPGEAYAPAPVDNGGAYFAGGSYQSSSEPITWDYVPSRGGGAKSRKLNPVPWQGRTVAPIEKKERVTDWSRVFHRL